MATSKFIRFFRDNATGNPATGMSVWLVPQDISSPTYPDDYLVCTEHGTRNGVYYRNNVPDGEYKIYIDVNGGTTPVLYEEYIWVGEDRLSTIADHFDSTDSYRLKGTGIKDSAVTTTKLADYAVTSSKLNTGAVTAIKLNSDVFGKGIVAGGTGAIDVDPDNSTLEVDLGTDKLQVKDGGITATQIATDAVTNPKIQAGSIDDSKIASGANIAVNKLAKGTQGQILVTYLDDSGAPFTEPRWVTVAGDATFDEYGNISIANAAISTAKIADNAVDKSKINVNVAGSGLDQDVDGSLKADVDNSTIEVDLGTNKVQVKDGGITANKLAASSVSSAKFNSDIYGKGIVAGETGAIDANVDDATIEIDAGTNMLQIKDSGVTNDKIQAGTIAIDRIDADFTKKMNAGIGAITAPADLPSDYLKVVNINALCYFAFNDLSNFTFDGQKI